MGKTMCPGQDTAFWRPGDVYEVPCSQCGHEVEFFKDDATRRCTACGQLMRNPKLNLGCAQWCEHAKDCLGYDPKEIMDAAEGGDSSLVDKLIAALKARLGGDQTAFSRALATLEGAKRIMSAEGGSPRVVLPAALLAGLEGGEAKVLLKELGLDADTRDGVAGALSGTNGGRSLEARVVADAAALAGLGEANKPAGPEEALEYVAKHFATGAGRELALRELAR